MGNQTDTKSTGCLHPQKTKANHRGRSNAQYVVNWSINQSIDKRTDA